MEYPQRQRSALLAQILQQMQQQQQFQPQSYGALAAGLGAQYLNRRSLNKEQERIQQEEAAQKTSLSEALGRFGRRNTEMPASQEWPGVEADPQLAQSGLLADTISNDNPMAQALAGQLLSQQFSPQQAESPFAKIDPSKYTPESVAGFQRGGGKDYSTLQATSDTSEQPAQIKIAQFLYPGDEKKQREHLKTTAASELPAQIQIAMWAADGDTKKARELVLSKLGSKDLGLSDVAATVAQKMVKSEKLTAGEQAFMDWYKQNPLAFLIGLAGAAAGTKVED